MPGLPPPAKLAAITELNSLLTMVHQNGVIVHEFEKVLDDDGVRTTVRFVTTRLIMADEVRPVHIKEE